LCCYFASPKEEEVGSQFGPKCMEDKEDGDE
jgi:hypothetical protein